MNILNSALRTSLRQNGAGKQRPLATFGLVAGMAVLASSLFVAHASAARVAWVSFHSADNTPATEAANLGFTMAPDVGYTQLLTSAGHTVTRVVTVNDLNANQAVLDQLNAPNIDLVIIGRSIDSAHYQTAAEGAAWNTSVNKPLMVMSGFAVRNTRLGFVANDTLPDTNAPVKLNAAVPAHQIFAGIALDGSNNTVDDYTTALPVVNNGTLVNITQRGFSPNALPIDAAGAGGTLLATVAAGGSQAGNLVIAEWAAGTSITKDTGALTLSNKRMAFLSGTREHDGGNSRIAGIMDLTPTGKQLFLNAVAYMGGPGFHPGDVDKNGVVDINDFNAIKDHFQQSVTMREQGDLSGDGFVDWRDFREWKSNNPFPSSGAGAAVPEPGSALLFATSALLLSLGAKRQKV